MGLCRPPIISLSCTFGVLNYFIFPCKAECDGWIRTAILLVEELSGETIEESENEEENGNGEAVKTMHAEPSIRSEAWVREIYSIFVGRKLLCLQTLWEGKKGALVTATSQGVGCCCLSAINSHSLAESIRSLLVRFK